jgi:catechol 2,3-dioxygenase-like lactoylglutathione lyase family enzyme
MNHTGFVVRDMERALAFYRDILGFVEERNAVIDGERISTLTGFPDARLHAVVLGIGDMRHCIELLQYLHPAGVESETTPCNQIGAAHLGFIVDDLEAFHQTLSASGIRFVNPPAIRADAEYPWAKKSCYLQDPEGNWLEFIERDPQPPDADLC